MEKVEVKTPPVHPGGWRDFREVSRQVFTGKFNPAKSQGSRRRTGGWWSNWAGGKDQESVSSTPGLSAMAPNETPGYYSR